MKKQQVTSTFVLIVIVILILLQLAFLSRRSNTDVESTSEDHVEKGASVTPSR